MSTKLHVQSGLVIKSPGQAEVARDLAIPSPDAGQLLIKTHAVALNPSDWMVLDGLVNRPGAGMGYDFAGTVEEIGAVGAKHTDTCIKWNVGDSVAGFVHGGHAADYAIGAFREYLLVDADMVIRVPDHVSLAEAATLGMGITTAGQALYQSLQLCDLSVLNAQLEGQISDAQEANDRCSQRTILIYGGGTATGGFAIQLAKLSGLRVITTCSKQSISRVQTLHPDTIIDYHSPDAITTIRNHVQQSGLTLILDCVANDSTAAFCYQCFTPSTTQTATADAAGGTASSTQPDLQYSYASLLPIQNPPRRPESIPATAQPVNEFKLVYTCFGRRFNLLGQTWEACPADRAFAVSFYRTVERLLERSKLQFMPIDERRGDWKAVLDGILELQRYGSHGRKLVYLTAEAT